MRAILRAITLCIALAVGTAAQADEIEGFPYPLIKVAGADAVAKWQALRETGEGSPVILGPREVVEEMAYWLGPQEFGRNWSVEQILEAADGLTHPASLFADVERQMQDLYERYPDLTRGPLIPEEMIGTRQLFPIPQTTVYGLWDYATNAVYDEVYIGVFPTDDPAEVFAYLRWGGWNANPLPEYHVVAFRAWQAEFGAELVMVTRDTLDVAVSAPPKSWDTALGLAKEMYVYDADIVDQGVGQIAHLAGILQVSPYWFFWWD